MAGAVTKARRTGRHLSVRIASTSTPDTIEQDKVWCGGLGRYVWRPDVLRGRSAVVLRLV